jgi:pyrroloquinoline quinone biosynthesis protein D
MSGPMNESLLDRAPRLPPGCRLNEAGTAEDLLLIPEGALRLKGPGRAIVELCDGSRTVRGIADELARRYSADPARVESDVVAMLTRLADRGALEYV